MLFNKIKNKKGIGNVAAAATANEALAKQKTKKKKK